MKAVLVGESGAGKSALAQRYFKGSFLEGAQSTLAAGFFAKAINGQGEKFEVWDTAGQERFHVLGSLYYRNAVAVILVFDATTVDECEGQLSLWVRRVKDNQGEDVPFLLVAAKSDLYEDGDLDAKLKDLRKKLECGCGAMFLGHAVTSAKTGENVGTPFEMALKEGLRKKAKRKPRKQGSDPRLMGSNSSVELGREPLKKNRCC